MYFNREEICFTRYDHGSLIRMLSLYYHELMGKTE